MSRLPHLPTHLPTHGVRAASSWSDPEVDTTEEARFLDVEGGGRIIAFRYGPLTRTPVGGVVLCGSIYEDFQVNYRREVLVAREIAKLGLAVVRFHYRGFGNSDAAPGGHLSFDSMRADAQAAAAWLVAETGVSKVAWCGSRMGALVAADQAAQVDGAPLVLWSPIASGGDFFKGMSRASLLAGVRATAKKKEASASAEQRLKTEPIVEMLGNRVQATAYEDLRVRTYPDDVGTRPVLIVQLGKGTYTVANQAIADRWEAAGAMVDALHIELRQMWSIPTKWEPENERPEAVSLIEGIPRWIETTMRGPS